MNRKTLGIALFGGAVMCVLGSVQTAPNERQHKRQLMDSIQGQALYQEYCAVCHGEDARGRSSRSGTLGVAPPDLTHIAMRNGGRFPINEVQTIISGESEAWPYATREMPLWGQVFSESPLDKTIARDRIHDLAEYLITIQRN